jgi:hypothetical protein
LPSKKNYPDYPCPPQVVRFTGGRQEPVKKPQFQLVNTIRKKRINCIVLPRLPVLRKNHKLRTGHGSRNKSHVRG